MTKTVRVLGLICGLASLKIRANSQTVEPGRKMELTSCTSCHGTRIIDSQRLSAAAWGKEIDKMAGWGAIISDRQLLLEYLSSQFSDCKSAPLPASSTNGIAGPRSGR